VAKQHRIQKDERSGNYFVRIQVAGTRKYFNLGQLLKPARRDLARLEKQIAAGELAFSSAEHDPCTRAVPARCRAGTAAALVQSTPVSDTPWTQIGSYLDIRQIGLRKRGSIC